MPILFKCELCRARLSISRKKAGKMGTCPKCGEPIHIPAISDASQQDASQQNDHLTEASSRSRTGRPDKFKREKNEQKKSGLSGKSSSQFVPSSKLKPEFKKGLTDSVADQTSSGNLAALGDSNVEVLPHQDSSTGLAGPNAESHSMPASETLAAGYDPSDSDDRIFDITEQYVDESGATLPAVSNESAVATETTNDGTEEGQESVLQSILVPRWIVYFQAGLIGVVAATFFVFGMMVGNLTSGTQVVQTDIEAFKITGRVENGDLPDSGAVVIALPATAKPDPRPEPGPLHPDQFEPIDNPSLDQIRDMGGDVVRVNRNGEFELEVDGPAEYYLLVISKSQSRQSTRLKKSVSAKLGRYFLPYEPLIDGKEINWTKVRMTSDKDLGAITF